MDNSSTSKPHVDAQATSSPVNSRLVPTSTSSSSPLGLSLPIELKTPSLLAEAASLLCDGLGVGHASSFELTALVSNRGAVFGVFDSSNCLVGVSTVGVASPALLAKVRAHTSDVLPEGATAAVGQSSAVNRSWRGHGIGQQLADVRVQWAKDQGFDFLLATSWRSGKNESFNLWSRAGASHAANAAGFWADYHTQRKPCPNCGPTCQCTASIFVADLANLPV